MQQMSIQYVLAIDLAEFNIDLFDLYFYQIRYNKERSDYRQWDNNMTVCYIFILMMTYGYLVYKIWLCAAVYLATVMWTHIIDRPCSCNDRLCSSDIVMRWPILYKFVDCRWGTEIWTSVSSNSISNFDRRKAV